MFDRLIYRFRKPKYCKHCGGKLVTDEKFDYSEQTGEPIIRHVGIRCEFYYACFKKHGYLFKWRESAQIQQNS